MAHGDHAARAALRKAQLLASDAQLWAATPSPVVNTRKTAPGLGIAKVIEAVMEGYADRPAVGWRHEESIVDPVSGTFCRRFRSNFETLTYREIWTRARRLAAVWAHDTAFAVHNGDLVCIMAFAGPDYLVVDMAAMLRGAVTVPLQTNARPEQLAAMLQETAPRCVAVNLECLDKAVDAILAGHVPASLLVFDIDETDEAQLTALAAASARLRAAGLPTIVGTLKELMDKGAGMPLAPVFDPPAGEDLLSTIYYTSGTTGAPKGAMYRESMVRHAWLNSSSTPSIVVHFLPMNHPFGRSRLFSTLANGGICYFAAKSDLSTLFEDIKSVRPTSIVLVPRICEMIFQRYQSEIGHGGGEPSGEKLLNPEALERIRVNFLGGRIVEAVFGSAPITPELRAFIEATLDTNLIDGYGTTETSMIAVQGRIQRPPVIDYKLIDVPELGYFLTDKPYPRGELLVKTSTLMGGYYKRPEVTAAMFDEDGYYKTGDIMALTGPDEIAYVDRRSNVIKLAQGEFVAVAGLEAAYNAGHKLIKQAYLYGNSSRAYLLGVIVPDLEAAAAMGLALTPEALKGPLREAIQEVAQAGQLHAYEIPRDFIVEMEPFSVENGLLAGVGKYLRANLKNRYGAELERRYEEVEEASAQERNALRRVAKDAPVLSTLVRAVETVLGIGGINPEQNHDFTALGGDSLAALSLSMLLEEIFEIPVPVGVIANPASNLRKLATYIEQVLDGEVRPSYASIHGKEACSIAASDLTLDRFIDAATVEAAATLPLAGVAGARTVLMTGANGYLGRFLCLEWLEHLAKTGGRLICIARGTDDADARRRIMAAFDSGDPELLVHVQALSAYLEVIAGDISEPDLGLAPGLWQRLAETVDLIVHPAALVNHVLPYEQLFGPNVVGTAELIRLALSVQRKPFCNISTIAVAHRDDGGLVTETDDIRHVAGTRSLSSTGYASGYAISKWAGEVLLREAHEQFGLPVTVFRSDMILAHRRYRGQLNVPDMFTRWLYSLVVTGIAPCSFYAGSAGEAARAHYDGLPVDFIAKAVGGLTRRNTGVYRTYHVLNPHDDGISLDSFVEWIIAAGYRLHRVADYADWFTRFETALRALPEASRQRSSLPLLHQLKQPMPGIPGAAVRAAQFRADLLAGEPGEAMDIPHLSAALIGKYLSDLKHLGFI